MSLGLELDAERQAVRDAVASFCRAECDDARCRAAEGSLDRSLWRGLAELGVLSLALPGAEAGGRLELVASFEALGAALFPGPLVETVLALPLLDAGLQEGVVAGERVVAVGTPPLLSWAPEADVFVAFEAGAIGAAWLCRPTGPVEALETLAGDPWGRVALEHVEALGEVAPSLAGARLASGAYLAAAGSRLLEEACAHARARRQFGRAIGEFQAVAHPLADVATRLGAAAMAVRVAARADHEGTADAPAWIASARLSAREAALAAVHVCHQVFGAVGITREGPAFQASRRIRQLASALPGDARAREDVLAAIGLEGVAA